LLTSLGQGAFGSVWKARDTELDRIVAVKIPRADRMTGEDAENFLREARAAAQVSHPNIVAVHEVGREAAGIGALGRNGEVVGRAAVDAGTAGGVSGSGVPDDASRPREIAGRTASVYPLRQDDQRPGPEAGTRLV
jgi:hypothetical protein